MENWMTIYRDCGVLGEEVEFEVFFYYSYDRGCQYLPNGDPGYPSEELFEVNKVIMHLDDKKIDVTDLLSAKFEEDEELLVKANEILLDAKNGGEF